MKTVMSGYYASISTFIYRSVHSSYAGPPQRKGRKFFSGCHILRRRSSLNRRRGLGPFVHPEHGVKGTILRRIVASDLRSSSRSTRRTAQPQGYDLRHYPQGRKFFSGCHIQVTPERPTPAEKAPTFAGAN